MLVLMLLDLAFSPRFQTGFDYTALVNMYSGEGWRQCVSQEFHTSSNLKIK